MTWTHFRDTTQTSRKPRVCYLCGQRIAAWSQYLMRVGVDGREFVRTTMHLPCEQLTEDWAPDDWACHSPGDGDEWPKYDEQGDVIKEPST